MHRDISPSLFKTLYSLTRHTHYSGHLYLRFSQIVTDF